MSTGPAVGDREPPARSAIVESPNGPRIDDLEAIESAAAQRRNRRGRVGQFTLFITDAAGLALLVLACHYFAAMGSRQPHWLPVAVLGIGVWLVLLHVYGRYPRVPRTISAGTLDDLPHTFHASLIGALCTAGLLAIGPSQGSFWALLVLFCGALTVLAVIRILVPSGLHRWLGPSHTLVVGDGPNAATTLGYLESRPGIRVVDHVYLGDRTTSAVDMASPRLVDDHDLRHLLAIEQVDRVVLITHRSPSKRLSEQAHQIRQSGVSLTIVPDHVGIFGAGASIDQLNSVTAVSLQPPALSRTAQTLKRLLDIAAASIGLFLLVPFLIVASVAIRLDSRGPVLFRQNRIGRDGRPFYVLKFRTMRVNADQLTEELMAQSKDPNWLLLEHDPRVTRIGHLLRSSSLDELPQLWNVIRGDMSLVGPRPLSVRDDTRVDGWGRGRLDLTPGITGLWQVLGRTSIPFDEMVRLDYLYVSNWSLWGDILLLLRTLPAVLSQRGVN